MWMVVYMAQGKKQVQRMSDALSNEGVLTKIQPVSKNMDEEEGFFEVLVPEAEVEEAHTIILEAGL